jgi:hypothetical protein
VPANINDTSIANQRNNAPNSNILAVWATTTTSTLLKNVKADVVEMDHHKISVSNFFHKVCFTERFQKAPEA